MSRQAENAAETATLLDRSLSDDALRRHRCTIRGRDHETNQIWQAYQRVVTDGKKESMTTQSSSHRHHRQSEVILVSGPSGVGKSALANWLYTHQPHRDKASSTTDSTPETVESSGTKQTNYKDTYRRRPLFVNVQFDSLQHPDPYHDLSEALTEFVQLAIAEPQDIAHLREGWASLLSLDRNSECQTLMDTFPAFRAFLVDSNEQELLPTNETVRSKPGKDSEWKLISKSVKDTPSMYSETGARLLKNTLGLFVRAVACRRQRPLVFVFDDLHRANERSLDIVQALLEDKEICSAVFVATYEEKETYVNALSNPLRRFLDKLRIAKVRNTRLSLSSLGESDINSILVNDLHVEAGSSLSLSSLLMARTRGNCFGVWEYLRLMHKRKILFWDWSTDRCCFHMEEIRIQELDIDELIRTRINKLSEYNQNILKTAACLGRQIDPTILTCFTSGDDQSFQNFTARALMNDLICYDKDQNSWRFTHDLVQEIAYSLIPVNERPVFHYRIGRKLWRSFDLDMVDCYIFLIVEQLCHYVNQIEYKKERYAIAKLCLCAGVRAVRLSSFHSSMVFLEHGMSLLGTTSWDQEYTTCLDLHSAAAEVANSLGHFDQTKEIVGQILIHAKQFRDTFRGNAALVHSLSSDGKYSDAVKLAFNLLYQLGERFPAKTSRLSTALEFYTLKRRLSRKTNESILRLPLMTDENKLAAMQMLNLVFLSALLSNDKIIPILGFRMVRMSLDYGICAVSCIGFALFGGCLCSLGNIDEGYRMSEICYGIYEMVDAKVWLCRISAVNFYFIHGWVRPLSECLEPLNHAFQVGLETGDIEFALSCKLVQSFTRNEMGRLPELFDNVRDLRELMITYGQSASVIITASQYQLMRNLMEVGKSEPWNMMGEFIDETTLLAIQSIKMVNAWNQMHRALLSFLFGRFPEAAEYAKNCRELAMRSSGPLAGGQVLFYCGLVDVANARLQKKFRAPFARQCSNALWRSSVNGGILNFIGKHYILEAELAALSGRTADALRLYVTAISTSKNGKLIFQTALANERTARFIWEAKDYSLAKEFFIEALVWYKEYGAGAKVAHLEDEIRRLY